MIVGALAHGGLGGLFVALTLVSVVELYLWTMQMRALGLLYARTKHRLGWFR